MTFPTLKPLTSTWGHEATVSLADLHATPQVWRGLLYQSKLLVLRGLPALTMDQLWDVHTIFGTPWAEHEYRESLEGVKCETPGKYLTVYGNQTSKKSIGDRPMPWHRDIPWHRHRRYPIRSLYPIALENSLRTNTTRFCDADALWRRVDPSLHAELCAIQLKIQNWYQMIQGAETVDTQSIPLVEQHPLTKRLSVLLNSFGPDRPDLTFSTAKTGTWILDATGGLERIQELHKLVCTPDNIYEHEWRAGDLVLFDNYSGVFHNRGRLRAANAAVEMNREFWRMNLKHAWQV